MPPSTSRAAGAGARLTTHQPSGFFAFRTPLMPFDAVTAWSEGLDAGRALEGGGDLEAALERDRRLLAARLEEVVSRPEVREALFLASPDLDGTIEQWRREPAGERGRRIEAALARYFLRMAGRATPFGLFAGACVGTLGPETRLRCGTRDQAERHTRLDMDYLFSLAETLAQNPALRETLVYRPNGSLYRAGGRVRYVEARVRDRARTYHLVAVDDTPYLAAILERARSGARPAELAAALIEREIPLPKAARFIDRLIESQILVPDLSPLVTGPEPLRPLIQTLAGCPETAAWAEILEQVDAELAALDRTAPGASPERYRAAAHLLESLPAKVELPRLFQVDVVTAGGEAALGPAVIEEVGRAVEILRRVSEPPTGTMLERFREAFAARYETREVPLLEALDEECGVGLGVRSEPSPLLRDLNLRADGERQSPGTAGPQWSQRDGHLLRRLVEALQAGSTQLELTGDDLEKLSAAEPPPLPDAFGAMVTLAASSEEAVAAGEFRVFLGGASGPSGATLLGRFCHGDPDLRQRVEEHVRAEEALRPDAVFAEIVHLPEGRVGNVLCRPVLREYEIPFLGRSGAPQVRQIPVSDLLVSVHRGRLRLRSASLDREVVPRLTNAHYFASRSLGVYRFLCALQFEGGAAGLSWSWGALQSSPYLPRVVCGRVILSLATWQVPADELKPLGELRGAALFRAVQEWRAQRKVPRWVALTQGDNVLPIDLENILSIETFIHLSRNRPGTVLTELFPGPGQLCARGADGSYVHELLIPFVKKDMREQDERVHPAPSSISPLKRSFLPGSEWLLAKLYSGPATVDAVLRDAVAPLVRAAVSSGAADRWFYLRYGDPDWHLRVRLHGDPARLRSEVEPALAAATAGLLEDGRLWKVELGTYEREVERYGGPEAIELAERLFHADSDACLEIIEKLERGDAGLDERWRLCLCGMDRLLADLGFDLPTRLQVARDARAAYAAESRVDGAAEAKLSARFREERKSLEPLIEPTWDPADPLAPGFEILAARSACLAPVTAELRRLEEEGRLATPLAELAQSFLHMHANRLLRSGLRRQEFVLWDFLLRLYESKVVRSSTRNE